MENRNEELEELRKQIDETDDELIEIYLKRLAVSEKIAEAKAAAGAPVYDAEREKKVIFRLAKKVPEDMRLYVKELYETIFATGKAYQNRFIEKGSKTAENIRAIIEKGLPTFPASGTCACQGVYGANSGLAAEKLFAVPDVTYFKSFEAVFGAVDKGLCEYGVLPIENSTAGSVSEVYDLMRKYRFSIVKSVRVRIEHCLAGVKGAKLSDIKKVVSHPQALSQCEKYLKSLGVKTEVSENTAIAAESVAEAGDKTVAALCSERSAERYGLEILTKNAEDSDGNYTRFILITKDLRIYKGANKISVMTNLAHTPGSLNRILGGFYALGLNLTKIESRPTAGFEFTFYFDFEGDVTDENVLRLISDLESGSDKFVFLGSYGETV